jgi:hypothetical protein
MAAHSCPSQHPPFSVAQRGWGRRPVILLVLLIATVGASLAGANAEDLDRYGCHHNRKMGDYHCHRATTAPTTPSDSSTRPSSTAPLAETESTPAVVKKAEPVYATGRAADTTPRPFTSRLARSMRG